MDTKKVDYSHQEYLSDDKVGTPPISDHDVPSFVNGRPVGVMTAEEKHAALEQAQLEDPGVPYSDRRFIFYILTVLCVCLCGGGEPSRGNRGSTDIAGANCTTCALFPHRQRSGCHRHEFSQLDDTVQEGVHQMIQPRRTVHWLIMRSTMTKSTLVSVPTTLRPRGPVSSLVCTPSEESSVSSLPRRCPT
jgi:hypothetical protein